MVFNVTSGLYDYFGYRRGAFAGWGYSPRCCELAPSVTTLRWLEIL